MESPNPARQAIVDAAEELFARYGFRKTSIDDIARAARVGKGSVYLHFSSKEELFAEIVRRASDRLFDTLTAAVSSARTPAARLRAFIETKSTALAVPASRIDLEQNGVVEMLPLAACQRQALLAKERLLLLQILRDGAASGGFVLGRPDRLASGIMAWLDAYDAVAASRREDPKTRPGLDALVALILRGLNPTRLTRHSRPRG